MTSARARCRARREARYGSQWVRRPAPPRSASRSRSSACARSSTSRSPATTALWDPWETALRRGRAPDARSATTASACGGPARRKIAREFWSKPVLTFWLMALSMKLFGLEWAHAPRRRDGRRSGAPSGRCACRRAAWRWRRSGRCGSWCAGSRAVAPRALAAIVLATSSQWLLITRQAMTDMPFVAPMTIALVLRRRWRCSAPTRSSRPRCRARRCAAGCRGRTRRRSTASSRSSSSPRLPQLIVISVQLTLVGASLGVARPHHRPRADAAVHRRSSSPASGGARARNESPPALPLLGLVLVRAGVAGQGSRRPRAAGHRARVYLVVAGRWRDIFCSSSSRAARSSSSPPASRGTTRCSSATARRSGTSSSATTTCTAPPGRHGDRGTFEYYLQYIGYGMFPWSGIAALGRRARLHAAARKSPRAQLVGFALVWFLVEFATVSLVNTKFHHYILPALPALAILAGLFLDDVLARADARAQLWGCCSSALPLTFCRGRDLAAFPPRFLWMFNYDYVNVPGTGRPWPTVALYGDRYEYGAQILVFAIAAALAVGGLTLVAWLTRKRGRRAGRDAPPSTAASRAASRSSSSALVVVGAGRRHRARPVDAARRWRRRSRRWAWLLPTLLMLVLARPRRRALLRAARRCARGGPACGSSAPWPWCGPASSSTRSSSSCRRTGARSTSSPPTTPTARAPTSRSSPGSSTGAARTSTRATRSTIRPSRRPRRPSSSAIATPRRCRPTSRRTPDRRVFFIVERVRFEALRGSCRSRRGRRCRSSTRATTSSTWRRRSSGTSAPLGTRSERLDHDVR